MLILNSRCWARQIRGDCRPRDLTQHLFAAVGQAVSMLSSTSPRLDLLSQVAKQQGVWQSNEETACTTRNDQLLLRLILF